MTNYETRLAVLAGLIALVLVLIAVLPWLGRPKKAKLRPGRPAAAAGVGRPAPGPSTTPPSDSSGTQAVTMVYPGSLFPGPHTPDDGGHAPSKGSHTGVADSTGSTDTDSSSNGSSGSSSSSSDGGSSSSSSGSE